MRRILENLTSRRTSIALMAFVAVFGALGAWIPQSSLGNTEALVIWQEKNPLMARVADALGLHEIFSSWWFLTALAVFALALGIATVRLVRDSWRAWRGPGRTPRTALPGASVDAIIERAQQAGYRLRAASAGRYVLRRHGLGVWASPVLHVGMLLSLVWGALLLGTTTGAIADFSVGEVRVPGAEYYAVEDATDPPELGVPWRFDGMDVATWPSGVLKDVSARLSFFDGGAWVQRTVSVNDPLRIKGHTIYVQPGEFGDAALLRITDGEGVEHRIRMDFYFIEDGAPAYTDGPYVIGDASIEGRWDPYGVRSTKPLGLRPAGDDSFEPVTLAPGETATVGDLAVEFVGATQWARVIVQRSPSVTPLFFGFAIIGLGSLMLYAWVPRELVLEEADDGLRYSWYAARMSPAYLPERDAILGLTTNDGEER
jgi:cytochrome c biogenesis protein ResB